MALIAFHGLRSAEIRALHLIDVRDGRLHMRERTLPLAQPVTKRLAAYLDYRNARWPNTANPHLFVTGRTAIGTSPLGSNWIWRTLGMSARAIRQDRILDEARASQGDVRRLCDLFDVTVRTAIRYAEVTADHPDLSG